MLTKAAVLGHLGTQSLCIPPLRLSHVGTVPGRSQVASSSHGCNPQPFSIVWSTQICTNQLTIFKTFSTAIFLKFHADTIAHAQLPEKQLVWPYYFCFLTTILMPDGRHDNTLPWGVSRFKTDCCIHSNLSNITPLSGHFLLRYSGNSYLPDSNCMFVCKVGSTLVAVLSVFHNFLIIAISPRSW